MPTPAIGETRQLTLFDAPATAPATDAADQRADAAPPDLDALIQVARLEAARASEGGAVGALVARLARGDGSASVRTLRAEGFPSTVIASAVSVSAADRRVKPRAKLGIVGAEPFVWLTTTGWQAAGRASGRERPPSAESAEHAAAPTALRAWLDECLRPWDGLSVSVATGDATREFSERIKAIAWGRVTGSGDTTGSAGALTGGLIPDGLLIERYPDAATYVGAWGQQPTTAEDLAEQTLALEVEHSAKREAPLRWKVERWATAIQLGAVFAVVWVVKTAEIADRLGALGVGQADSRQLLVPGSCVGLGGDSMPELAPSWWPLRLAASADAR